MRCVYAHAHTREGEGGGELHAHAHAHTLSHACMHVCMYVCMHKHTQEREKAGGSCMHMHIQVLCQVLSLSLMHIPLAGGAAWPPSCLYVSTSLRLHGFMSLRPLRNQGALQQVRERQTERGAVREGEGRGEPYAHGCVRVGCVRVGCVRVGCVHVGCVRVGCVRH